MNTNLPGYVQLYQAFRDEIIQGVWPYGAKLPSRRQTSRDRGWSAVTVEHSYELLCQEGYIEARPKSGFYVIYRTEDGFAQTERPRSFTPPAPSFRQENAFPFSVLARTMRRVITEYGEALLNKSPNFGCDTLRQALSRYLARNRGIRADESQIIIGAGAEYLYGLVAELLGTDRLWGIECPSYEKIEQVYRAKGISCDLLPLGHDGIESAALRETAASVLHITPFRSFPSGVTASASKRQEYIRWADRENRFLVEDDFESEFSLLRKPEETVFSQAKKENVIYLNTFSRTVSPSIRVGYMVLPKALLPEFTNRLGFYSCTVPAFEQYVLSELLDGGDFERHVNRIRRQERKKMAEKSADGDASMPV